jgi:8-oxo-dGTP pyrophosphatase MutT (NUDIX family)
MKPLFQNWRRFLNENKNAVPMFKKAKIKPYIDLGLFAEGENMPKGSAVVIFDKEGRVLILLRPETVSWAPGKWALPGGHIEEGETPMMAAVREVREETSLAVPNPQQFHVSRNGEVVYFVADHYAGDVEIDFEHDDFAWVYPDELTNYDRVPELDSLVRRAKEAL